MADVRRHAPGQTPRESHQPEVVSNHSVPERLRPASHRLIGEATVRRALVVLEVHHLGRAWYRTGDGGVRNHVLEQKLPRAARKAGTASQLRRNTVKFHQSTSRFLSSGA